MKSATVTATATTPTPSTDLPIADLAAFYKACSDELRLQILRVLHQDAYGVLELSEILGVKQSGMSHHLKVLADAGMVRRRREGNSIFYSRAPLAEHPALQPLQQGVFETSGQLTLAHQIQVRMNGVQAQRAEHSNLFFQQNASVFRQQQEQITEFHVYADAVLEQLDALSASERQSVLEVGPGSGQLLPALQQRFGKVSALDNSEQMLNHARETALQQGCTQIRFIAGDTAVALARGERFHAVVMNMVLHHVSSPADMLRDISQLLDDRGHLFIAELCDHDQDWVRNACGDFWLGINPNALSDWAAQHHLLEHGSGQYLSLRNGFRLQIRHFQKHSNTN